MSDDSYPRYYGHVYRPLSEAHEVVKRALAMGDAAPLRPEHLRGL